MGVLLLIHVCVYCTVVDRTPYLVGQPGQYSPWEVGASP